MRLKSLRAGVITLAVVVFGLIAAVTAAGYAADNARHLDYHVENETVVVDYGNLSTVEKADVAITVYDNETVNNSAGETLTEGQDYDFYTNGTIEWYDTPDTADGENATIAYTYSGEAEVTKLIDKTATPLVEGLPYAILIAVGVSISGAVGAFVLSVSRLRRRNGGGGLGR